jgi:hypothetical protein
LFLEFEKLANLHDYWFHSDNYDARQDALGMLWELVNLIYILSFTILPLGALQRMAQSTIAPSTKRHKTLN